MHMKNKFLTLILSFIPGVGHLYLGLMKRGMQLLAMFFGALFLIEFLRLHDELIILMPIIWFYSVFDALQQHELVKEGIAEDRPAFPWGSFQINQKWVAYTLIIVGGYILLDNLFDIARRYITFLHNYNFSTIFVAVVFLLIGIRLLSQFKKREDREDRADKEVTE
jgi:hypothetical protein